MKQPNQIVLFFPWCIHFTRGKSHVLLVPDLRCTVNLISGRRRCGQLIFAAINSKRQQKAWFIFHSWKIQSHLFVSGLDICRAGIPVTLRLALAARRTATSCRACFYQHAWILTHIVLAACVAHCISELYLQLSFNNHTHTHVVCIDTLHFLYSSRSSFYFLCTTCPPDQKWPAPAFPQW